MDTRLDDLLREHLADPFLPSITKGEDYGEIEPVMIDADIYGWASRVAKGGRLGVVERPGLTQARDSLVRSLHEIPPEARSYYERLVAIADEAIASETAHR